MSPTDFACAFSPWFAKIADRCATETGCKANGTVEATTSDDGCVVDIAMDRPNDAFVTCVVRDVGSVRCPCGKVTASYFLGLGNNGCTPCGREFVCPNGDVCVAGQCVRASPDAGKRDAGG